MLHVPPPSRLLLLLLLVISQQRVGTAGSMRGADCGAQECLTSEGDLKTVARCLEDQIRERIQQKSVKENFFTAHDSCARSLMQSVAWAATTFSGARSTPDTYRRTVELLDSALELDAVNPNLHFLKGNAFAALGEISPAAQAYASAVLHMPVHVDALHNYAAIMMDLPSRSPMQTESVIRALRAAFATYVPSHSQIGRSRSSWAAHHPFS